MSSASGPRLTKRFDVWPECCKSICDVLEKILFPPRSILCLRLIYEYFNIRSFFSREWLAPAWKFLKLRSEEQICNIKLQLKATLTNLNFPPNHVMQRGAVLEGAILSCQRIIVWTLPFFSSNSIYEPTNKVSLIWLTKPCCKKRPPTGQILSKVTKW